MELHDAIRKFLEVQDDRYDSYQFLLLHLALVLLFSLFLLTFHFWNSDIFIFQKSEINSTGGDSISEMFGLVFDDCKKMPTEISDSNIWFSLDHPKVHVDGASCEFTSTFW
jgi:hypothetical protein